MALRIYLAMSSNVFDVVFEYVEFPPLPLVAGAQARGARRRAGRDMGVAGTLKGLL